MTVNSCAKSSSESAVSRLFLSLPETMIAIESGSLEVRFILSIFPPHANIERMSKETPLGCSFDAAIEMLNKSLGEGIVVEVSNKVAISTSRANAHSFRSASIAF